MVPAIWNPKVHFVGIPACTFVGIDGIPDPRPSTGVAWDPGYQRRSEITYFQNANFVGSGFAWIRSQSGSEDTSKGAKGPILMLTSESWRLSLSRYTSYENNTLPWRSMISRTLEATPPHLDVLVRLGG